MLGIDPGGIISMLREPVNDPMGGSRWNGKYHFEISDSDLLTAPTASSDSQQIVLAALWFMGAPVRGTIWFQVDPRFFIYKFEQGTEPFSCTYEFEHIELQEDQ